MIVEQAFFALPEILCGNQYPKQDYEAGLVTAYTLAVLQELNGRNVDNPLSCIKTEKLYRYNGIYLEKKNPRYLRCDLHINFKKLDISNRGLKQLGWRPRAYLESKFFRTGKGKSPNSNATNNLKLILQDLTRLATLPRPSDSGYFNCSRYLLHVYDRNPENYFSEKTKESDKWIKSIQSPGASCIEMDYSKDTRKWPKESIGSCTQASLKLKVYNRLITPVFESKIATFHCILTRIDEIDIRLNGATTGVKPSGHLKKNDTQSVGQAISAYNEISSIYSKNINKKEDEEEKLDDSDDVADEESVDDDEKE